MSIPRVQFFDDVNARNYKKFAAASPFLAAACLGILWGLDYAAWGVGAFINMIGGIFTGCAGAFHSLYSGICLGIAAHPLMSVVVAGSAMMLAFLVCNNGEKEMAAMIGAGLLAGGAVATGLAFCTPYSAMAIAAAAVGAATGAVTLTGLSGFAALESGREADGGVQEKT